MNFKNKLQIMILEEILNIIENNISANITGYNSKYAFCKNTDAIEKLKRSGYEIVNKKGEKNKISPLQELKYKDYKNINDVSNDKKVNIALHDVSTSLYRIEQFLKQNSKLMREADLNTDSYWKSTYIKLLKIDERCKRIRKHLREFGIDDYLF